MLGPEANHYMLVSHAAQLLWREGHLGDLIPLLGDGLLTIDGDFHRRSRRSCCRPSTASGSRPRTRVMAARRSTRRWTRLRPARRVDLYAWTRELALRIAMRALFGLDPDGARRARSTRPHEFEEALGF